MDNMIHKFHSKTKGSGSPSKRKLQIDETAREASITQSSVEEPQRAFSPPQEHDLVMSKLAALEEQSMQMGHAMQQLWGVWNQHLSHVKARSSQEQNIVSAIRSRLDDERSDKGRYLNHIDGQHEAILRLVRLLEVATNNTGEGNRLCIQSLANLEVDNGRLRREAQGMMEVIDRKARDEHYLLQERTYLRAQLNQFSPGYANAHLRYHTPCPPPRMVPSVEGPSTEPKPKRARGSSAGEAERKVMQTEVEGTGPEVPAVASSKDVVNA